MYVKTGENHWINLFQCPRIQIEKEVKMQEQMNLRNELAQKQLETIEHTLNRLIEHRAEIMDRLTLEDFSNKSLLSTPLSEPEILGLIPQVKETVIEQKTLEAGYRQLLVDCEAEITDLIENFGVLKATIESETSREHVNENDTDDILREYWDEFKEYCDTYGLSLVPLEWNRNTQYSGFRLSIKSVSDRDIWLAAWRKPDQTQIAVNLSLKLTDSRSEDAFDALGIFNALEQEKEDIEADFGGSLRWQRDPFFPALGPVVGVYENITPDRDDWQRQFEWIFTMLETLNRVFRPFVMEK